MSIFWETIEDESPPPWGNGQWRVWTGRVRTPGGWLVRPEYTDSKSTSSGEGLAQGIGVGLTFVPDPDFEWKLRPHDDASEG